MTNNHLIKALISLSIIISALWSQAAFAGFVEYYASLTFRESPYSPHKGVHRLTKEQAGKRNHYRFEYDDSNRIKEISFQLGDQLRPRNHTGNYFWYTTKEVYYYEGNKQIVTYFDHHNKPTSVHGDVYKSIYTINQNNRRQALEYQSKTGEKIASRWDIADYQWQHLNDGSVIETRQDKEGKPAFLRPGFEFNRVRLAYDVNGFNTLMQHVDDNNQLIATEKGFSQDRFTMSAKGELLRYDVLGVNHEPISANMQGIATGLQSFTDFGYEHISSYLDAKGNNAYNDNGWWKSERQYDQFGNMTSSVFQDLDGNPRINPNTGYAFARMKWHDNGLQRQWLKYFDASGAPVNHKSRGYQFIKYTYDNQSRLTRIQLFDAATNVVEHTTQGWSEKRYQYKSNEKIGEETRLSLKQISELQKEKQPTKDQHLSNLLDELRKITKVPGMSVAIAKNGDVLWQGQSGYADIEKQKPVTEDTQFRLASVSKSVTSMLIADLIEQGNTSLSQQASRALNINSKATIEQLLAHTGSFNHYNGLEGRELDKSYATSSSAAQTFKSKINSNPTGTEYQYSTFGYTLASAILEETTQKSFDQLIKEFANKHQLLSVITPNEIELANNMTQFYQIDGDSVHSATKRNFSYAVAGAGLISNASDLAKVTSLFAANELSTNKVTKSLLTPQKLNNGEIIKDRGYEVALGWRRQQDVDGNIFYQHAGITDGARSITLFNEKTGISIALLSNASWSADMFNTALSFYYLFTGNNPEGKDLISQDFNARLVNQVTNTEANEFAQWLGRSNRGEGYKPLSIDSSLFLLTPYGATIVDGRNIAIIGTKKIKVTS